MSIQLFIFTSFITVLLNTVGCLTKLELQPNQSFISPNEGTLSGISPYFSLKFRLMPHDRPAVWLWRIPPHSRTNTAINFTNRPPGTSTAEVYCQKTVIPNFDKLFPNDLLWRRVTLHFDKVSQYRKVLLKLNIDKVYLWQFLTFFWNIQKIWPSEVIIS